ncbi:MAG: hypothetical protein AMQ22_00052 [Candidatus Methanofastidiosum methylothiophilum]|uniref:Uncharacterized protein n=1 Tax=Candidatus Methanofastidiosum methylothiophilum TaxID=1705564 RepID=A0A150J9B0_9EURY|nr:MAG: hypothetical protein AMQ22_00052 [Candidatus Methanofastidiosum methylthiophilus]
MSKKEATEPLYIDKIPAKLKSELKIKAIERNLKLKELVIEYLEAGLKKDTPTE